MVADFQRRKKDTLSRLDKSSKGHWDEKISKLCEKINSLENYYTTSSCSGRIVLMIDSEKKQKDLFLKIYHDIINFEELKEDLKKIASLRSDINGSEPDICRGSSLKTIDIVTISRRRNLTKSISKSLNRTSRASKQMIKFKQEPCILHVACADLESARKLYDKAKFAGWKKSGIIASGKRFVVELNSTEKLEFPIMVKGKILVSDEFLKLIVKKANENLKKSWAKIERLKKSI